MFVCIYCRRFLTLPSRWLLSRVFQMLRYAWNYCCCWSNWPHCALSRSALGEHIIYHQLSVICYLLSVFSIRNRNCCYHNHIACVQLSWILSGMVVYGYAKKSWSQAEKFCWIISTWKQFFISRSSTIPVDRTVLYFIVSYCVSCSCCCFCCCGSFSSR